MPLISEFGHDHKSLKAEVLSNYAKALMLTGNEKEAIAPAEEAAAIFDEINKEDIAQQLRIQVELLP